MHYPFEKGLIRKPERYSNGLRPSGGLSAKDKALARELYPALPREDEQELRPSHSSLLNAAAGKQRSFTFTPSETRYYHFQTFGASDSVMILFEDQDGQLRHRAGDDDSGQAANAHFRIKLASLEKTQEKVEDEKDAKTLLELEKKISEGGELSDTEQEMLEKIRAKRDDKSLPGIVGKQVSLLEFPKPDPEPPTAATNPPISFSFTHKQVDAGKRKLANSENRSGGRQDLSDHRVGNIHASVLYRHRRKSGSVFIRTGRTELPNSALHEPAAHS